RMVPMRGPGRLHSDAIEQALLSMGVDRDIAQDLQDAVRQRAARRSVREIGFARVPAELEYSGLVDDLAVEVESRFDVQSELGSIAAFVGPPGAGKTTTLAKLAVRNGLLQGRRVRLISADSQRVGGADQLRTFAAILGVGFQAVESDSAL